MAVDLTAPAVTVTVPATTYDKTPEALVVATDPALADSVSVDVDTNNDNDFADASETGHSS